MYCLQFRSLVLQLTAIPENTEIAALLLNSDPASSPAGSLAHAAVLLANI